MDDFVKGTKVRVDGLVSALASRHNGKSGKILDVFPDTMRASVMLDDGSVFSVAIDKLTIQPAGRPAAGSMDLGKFGELKIGELKVGTQVIPVAIVEPFPDEKLLSINGYVKDFSPDGTKVRCTSVENPTNEKHFFIVDIKNLRVAPEKDDEIPLSLAIDISRPGIKLMKNPVLRGVNVKDLSGIESMESAEVIDLSSNKIASLEKVVHLPPRCLELILSDNQIASLENVVFVSRILRTLDLQGNQIKRLDGVRFPDSLTNLDLADNQITSVLDNVFPPNLKELWLDGNPISSIERLVLPTNLVSLKLPRSCKVSEDFLLKYKIAGVGHGPKGHFVGYELKASAAAAAPSRPLAAAAPSRPLAAAAAAAAAAPSRLQNFLPNGHAAAAGPPGAAAGPLDANQLYRQAMTTFDSAIGGPLPPQSAEQNKWHYMGPDGKMIEHENQGGNKSKTRRRQRQRKSKRNRKNKYSRRRRTSKSKSK